MKKQSLAIGILIILLLVAVGYIIFDKWKMKADQEQAALIQQAVTYGYEQAILEIMKEASQCQPVPLFSENDTMNIVSVECLQTPAKTGN
jgi:hypothetical protein